MSMNIDLGADIISSDGEKLGVVDSLVIEPNNGSIQAVVVRKGLFFPTDKILPLQMVTGIEGDAVRVNISKDDAEQLTEYMDSAYVMPPAGYYGGYGYMWPAASVYSRDLMVDEQIRERMPDAIILSEGTLVVDKDGDEVGRISEIASDDQSRVTGFKVEEGLFRHHEHYIPAHTVAKADDTVVQLSVDKGTLENVTGPHNLERGRKAS